MFFQNRNVYPSNVWFITVIAFNSVGLLRNKYFKISSNAPSNIICNIWKLIFYSLRQFSMFMEWYCIKRPFSSSLCGFLLFCVAIVISEPFFARAYFRPDFAAITRKKFADRYFWFKAKLKQKKFIFEYYSVASTWEIKIGRFYFLAGNHRSFLRRKAS